MADDADFAFDMIDASIANGVATISAEIAPGVAGICAECLEQMPRLVGGRCGFCRDGRVPPPSFYDSRPPAQPVTPAPIVALPKENDVTAPSTPGFKTISVPAKGAVLDAINAIAEAQDLPLGQAVIKLVESGLERETAVAEAALSSLADFSVRDLLDELHERLDRSQDQAAFDTAVQRAETAERKLAALRELIAG